MSGENGRIGSTPGSGNVFADLGLPEPEVHMAKARLVRRIGKSIEELGITQAEAAERMGIDQPKVSALLRGRFQGYSLDRLLRFLNALGHDVKITVSESHRDGEGEPTLEVVTA